MLRKCVKVHIIQNNNNNFISRNISLNNHLCGSLQFYMLLTIHFGTYCLSVAYGKNKQVLGRSKSKSRYDWRSVSQYVLVSSPFLFSRTDVCYFLTVTAVSLWGTGGRVCRLSVKSLQYLVVCQYIHKYLHFICLTYKVMYITISKAPVNPGSV
jgi:hypothetical protein